MKTITAYGKLGTRMRKFKKREGGFTQKFGMVKDKNGIERREAEETVERRREYTIQRREQLWTVRFPTFKIQYLGN